VTVAARSAALVVVLLGVTVSVAGCGPATAQPDEVVGKLADEVSGESVTLLLPTGTVTVTVGDPVDEVESGDTRDAEARQAPDGSSLLPVRLEHYLDAAPWGGLLAASPQEAEVTLVVDGETRSLGSPYLSDGRAIATNPERSFYVVVPGTPAAADVTVEVGYDGATQTAGFTGADPEGEAAALAALSADRPRAADCPADAWQVRPTGVARMACEVPLAARTPYWPGSGWAATEADWLVVAIDRLAVDSLTTSGGARAEVRSVTGLGEAAGLDVDDAGTTLAGTLVLDRPRDDVPLSLEVSVAPAGGGDPRKVRLGYDLAATES